MSAAVTVLSSRTTLPVSTFACRALASRMRLIASHVSARMALIVMCSTAFFGVQVERAEREAAGGEPHEEEGQPGGPVKQPVQQLHEPHRLTRCCASRPRRR